MSAPPDTTDVLRLWAAVVLLSLVEAWFFTGDVRGAPGALYVAANVLVFFAALLLLAHAAARAAQSDKAHPAVAYTALLSAVPAAPNTRAELTHLFVHLLCAAYLRTACWFEARALFEPAAPVRANHANRARI
jgi:hypothetical protein